jgi:hypothetical protein
MKPQEPKQGEIYEHFKGGKYKIIAVARNCEYPEKKVVVYEALYEGDFPMGTVWLRLLEDFLGFKELNGKQIKRFVRID